MYIYLHLLENKMGGGNWIRMINSLFMIRFLVHIAFFLVFDFLWETRKKMRFLARKIQEIQEISQYNLLGLLHFYVTFFGHFMEIHENFWPGG